jgi:DDE superfamily endonuclease
LFFFSFSSSFRSLEAVEELDLLKDEAIHLQHAIDAVTQVFPQLSSRQRRQWRKKLLRLVFRLQWLQERIAERTPKLPPVNAFFQAESVALEHQRLFRFRLGEIRRIAEQLLGPSIQTQSGCRAPSVTALMVVLAKLTYPRRVSDLRSFFGGSSGWLSEVWKSTRQVLANRAFKVLRSFPPSLLSRFVSLCQRDVGENRLPCLAWGAIDGFKMEVARALGQRNQAFDYNGYGHGHYMRALIVCAFNGMIGPVFGPHHGKENDASIVSLENVDLILDAFHTFVTAHFHLQERPILLADSGFAASENLLTPFFEPRKDWS